jgi:hypothetical protein
LSKGPGVTSDSSASGGLHNDPGVTRWELRAAFDNGPMQFVVAFKKGSKLIEGVDLRAAS